MRTLLCVAIAITLAFAINVDHLEAIGAARELASNAALSHNDFISLMSSLPAHLERSRASIKNSLTKRQATLPVGCLASFTALELSFECVSNGFSAVTTQGLNTTEVNDAVADACNASCSNGIRNAVRAFQAACQGQLDDVDVQDVIGNVVPMVRLLCTADDQQRFCLPQIRDNFNNYGQFLTTNLNSTVLDGVCTLCWRRVAAKFASFPFYASIASNYPGIAILCLRGQVIGSSNQVYCVLETPVFNDIDFSNISQANAVYSTVCRTNCIGRIANAFNQSRSVPVFASLSNADSVCVRRGPNDFCAVAAINAFYTAVSAPYTTYGPSTTATMPPATTTTTTTSAPTTTTAATTTAAPTTTTAATATTATSATTATTATTSATTTRPPVNRRQGLEPTTTMPPNSESYGYGYGGPLMSCAAIFESPASCPSNCTTVLNQFFNSLGCCTSFFLRELADGDVADLVTSLRAVCANTQPALAAISPRCNSAAAVGSATITVRFRGLRRAWALANFARVRQAVLLDLARSIGVAPNDMSITASVTPTAGATSATPGVSDGVYEFSVEVVPDSADFLAPIAGTTASDLILTDLNDFPATAYEDILVGVTADSIQSTTVAPGASDDGSAASLACSTAAVAAAAAFATLF